MKEWLTAREIADLALPNLAISESGVLRQAKTSEWAFRAREGRGGGREYSITVLPVAARKEYERRHRQKNAVQVIAEAQASTQRQIATIAPTALTARQRAVMEARAALLLEVDRRVMAEDLTVTAAIRALVADSRAGALPAHLMELAAVANDRSGGKAELGERIVYYWRSAKAEGGVSALAPQPTKTVQDLPPWFGAFLRHYARPQKPTVARALMNWRIAAEGEALPSYKQVRRALDKLGSVDKMRGREGAQALKARQAYTARDTSDLLPTSVYLADGKTFDAEVQHPIHGQPFRPEITTVIDAHSRKIVGFSAALDESAHAVLDALRAACCWAGIPAIFYTDRGPGYVNDAMDAAVTGMLGRLGITAMRALPYNSQAKGIVERVNHEWSHLARDFGSYISRDMDREAKKAVHQQSRRDLKQIGTTRLLPRWDEFLAACLAAILRYNARSHSGLPRHADPETGKWRHMSPDEAWEAACARGFEPLVVTRDEADDLFRPWVIRKTRRALVEWLGNEYFAPELEPHHGEDVIVGYDIRDASRVWVRAIDMVDGERQPGRLLAIAEFGGHRTRYVPLTAERAAMEKRQAGRVRRLENKLDVVQQEMRPMLDGVLRPLAAIAPDDIDIHAPISAPAPEPIRLPQAVVEGGRPKFSDDAAFARWVAANPEAATASDLALLRELISSQSMREVLRMSGVDLEALRALTRAAA
ncbi:Mu transposase C-terminal domain-containing protein [Xanthobacter sp. VTT E-85241]|uniref:Mu transposase C-terminal domain-containing protein n=1 Tax=Roseixanthobacter finlandensis TaxID=3119922 RepID=UPI0037263C10